MNDAIFLAYFHVNSIQVEKLKSLLSASILNKSLKDVLPRSLIVANANRITFIGFCYLLPFG